MTNRSHVKQARSGSRARFTAKLPRTFRFLPARQLKEVASLPAETARERILGGAIDATGSFLILLRGDETFLVAPLSIFRPSGDGTAPDFTDFGVTDYGHTVRFGAYEAAADAIFCECEPRKTRPDGRP